MPYRPHYRVSAIGRLGNSGEIFQYGVNMAPNGGSGTAGGLEDTASFNEDAWADVADDIRTFHGSAALNLASYAVLTHVKVARINALGKYDDMDPLIFDIADQPGANTLGTQAQTLPQAALAVSLVTARRGPTGKGRFYLPCPVVLIETSDLRLTAGQATAFATAAAGLITNLNNAPGIDVTEMAVCVASTKGYNTPVTGVRVGRVVDTIRSRRNRLVENHSTPVAVS